VDDDHVRLDTDDAVPGQVSALRARRDTEASVRVRGKQRAKASVTAILETPARVALLERRVSSVE
jgi:hypothetical protein